MTSSSKNELIELRFVGGGITPPNTRASELAAMLEAAEALITSVVLQEHDELTKDDLYIGLTIIEDKSLGLKFRPSLPNIVVPEFERLADAVKRRFFDFLPSEARDALRKIATFTRKNKCVAEFRSANSESILAVIEPELVIPIASRLHVQTTLYGRVVNAGGKNPNVHIETLQGEMVICKGTQTQVKQLAGRLYSIVGVTGTGRCDVDTLEIVDFEIAEILPYEDTPIKEAIQELAQLAAPYFADVDAAEFVRSIRDDNAEGVDVDRMH